MDNENIKRDIEKIIDMIDISLDELNSASNWGIFDIFKGGMFVSMIKNDKINRAERNIEDIHWELERLEDNLLNGDFNRNLSLDISDFLKFTDIFMDNVFSDIFVQGKISDSIYNLKELKSHLRDIYREL